MSAKSNFKAAVRKAKQLYKTGRYKKFSDAVKAAYKKGSGGTKRKRKVSAVKIVERGEKRSARPKKIYRVTRSKAGTFKRTTRINSIGKASLGTLLAEARRRHKDTINNLVVRKYNARLKRDKRKIQKQINEHNAALRKL
jgi:hypothetical protein